MLDELALDYSEYLKVDNSTEVNALKDVIEDMLTRLEEFQTFMEMVRALRAESTMLHYDTIKGMKSKVTELTKTVNNLEKLVNKVGEDVELVDQQLTEAESCMPINKEGPLNTILKPFFKKQDDHSTVKQLLTYEPPIIFKSDDFFGTCDSYQEPGTTK
ncbi:biogenesis of lysosome-related organelles complex 1 subunit 4 [Daktulosphaira vitifoliae]|uniref:biogenesis of lysosome-related organelles complex 1 subunit 4 n=1 Tax=Daktulosphaira vitifoliae TaxID=58002 RepID=UPI0021AAB591|nr:biogenesis of lysosome-related organelles complex 1 subunit 4 [Daktulosphaira vitifoliae]